MKPHRKIHGDRRYKRFIAAQRRKFGDLDVILPRWIADPDPHGSLVQAIASGGECD